MSDLIDRQATIDALHMHLMYRMGTDSNKKRLDDWINGLPSAQPKKEIAKRVLWTGWKGYRNTRYVPGEKQETIVRWDDE